MLRRAEKRCFRYGIISLCSIFFLLALYSPVYQPSSQREVMVQGWELNISRNTRHYVLPENITTLININNFCPPVLLLIVIVCSAPGNFEQRTAIRDTWASLADDSARVAFLLGESDNSTVQTKVQEESGVYEDIVQEGFVDSYNNLTIKSVMMLKWVQQNCPSAQFLMKSDDDIYLNLPALSEALRPAAKRKNILIGSLICKARPIQDSTNKWKTLYLLWTNFWMYPLNSLKTFDEEAPVVGDEEDNGNTLPVWEAVGTVARADEDDATIMTTGGPAVTFTITSDTGIIEDHPTEIVPEVLSWKRKNYLFQKIRPYCDEAHKDLLCPDPSPEPIATRPTNEEILPELEEEEEILLTPKPRKRARKQQTTKSKAAPEPGTLKKKKKYNF